MGIASQFLEASWNAPQARILWRFSPTWFRRDMAFGKLGCSLKTKNCQPTTELGVTRACTNISTLAGQ
jgi:hypothetical protein